MCFLLPEAILGLSSLKLDQFRWSRCSLDSRATAIHAILNYPQQLCPKIYRYSILQSPKPHRGGFSPPREISIGDKRPWLWWYYCWWILGKKLEMKIMGGAQEYNWEQISHLASGRPRQHRSCASSGAAAAVAKLETTYYYLHQVARWLPSRATRVDLISGL